MGIQRIESVTYSIADLGECARFFDDFGLFLVERTDEYAVFETLTGQTLHLDTDPGPLLPPPLEGGPTLREVVWGVDTQEELERLVAAVGRDHAVREDAAGVFHTVDETGFGVGLTLARPKPAPVTPRPANALGSVNRWNTALEAITRVHPCGCATWRSTSPRRAGRRPSGSTWSSSGSGPPTWSSPWASS